MALAERSGELGTGACCYCPESMVPTMCSVDPRSPEDSEETTRAGYLHIYIKTSPASLSVVMLAQALKSTSAFLSTAEGLRTRWKSVCSPLL